MNSGRQTCIHVIHSLEYGGAQRDLYYHARFHDRDRYSLEVVTFHPGGEMISDIEAQDIKVHTLGKKSSDPGAYTALRRIFIGSRASVIHLHNPLPVFMGLPAAAGVPVRVLTEHSINYPGRTGGHLKTAIYEWLRRRLDSVIACSEEVRRSHLGSIDPDLLVTILNGVDTDLFDPRSGIENSSGEARIASIGSLTPQKGYSFLIDAVKILESKACPVTLTFIGDGPLRDELEQHVKQSGLTGRVRFAGLQKDVPGMLKEFDIVAGSSLREGLPLGILEAMAAGKPVVTTDIGGNREAVTHGVTGLLVPPSDPSALADALEKLWTDREMRESMGSAGRARVEKHFSARKMVSDTEKLYGSILQRKSG